jgi:hypothetical protein
MEVSTPQRVDFSPGALCERIARLKADGEIRLLRSTSALISLNIALASEPSMGPRDSIFLHLAQSANSECTRHPVSDAKSRQKRASTIRRLPHCSADLSYVGITGDNTADFCDHGELASRFHILYPFVRYVLVAMLNLLRCAQARFVDYVYPMALTLHCLQRVGTASCKLEVSLVEQDTCFLEGFAYSGFTGSFSKFRATTWKFPEANARLSVGIISWKLGIWSPSQQQQDA